MTSATPIRTPSPTDRRWWDHTAPDEMLAALFMAYETARDHRHGAERSQSYDALRDMYTVGVQTYGVGDAGPEGGPICLLYTSPSPRD